jgi:hypothetical protein
MLERLLIAIAFALCATWPAAAQVSTYTTCLTIAKPVVGNPANTNSWGGVLNTDFDLLDQASAGILPVSTTGGTTILTSASGAVDQSRNAVYVVTGVLSGNATILWPQSLCRSFSVVNNTTGAFTLTLGVNNGSGSPAGNTVAIPQSVALSVYSDGTNIGTRATYTVPFMPTNPTRTTICASGCTISSSSGTYTTPLGSIRLYVRMVGGGGGGGASVTNTGSPGASSTFGASLTAGGGGGGGGGGSGGGGIGGTSTGCDFTIPGNAGQSAAANAATVTYGGYGGASIFGGAPANPINSAGDNAATNSGSGGSGAGNGTSGAVGSGGGAGAYCEKLLSTPASSYAYGIGAGGLGGAAGVNAGGNGGSGIIIIDEYYD